MKTGILLIVIFALSPLFQAQAQETPHLQFVTEYVRQLGAIESLRASAAQNLKAGGDKLSDCIRNTTSFQLELQSQVGMLETMHLNPPFEDLIKNLAQFYRMKIDAYKDFTEGCTALQEGQISGPKPDVDYGKIAGEIPKVTARLQYIDQAIFKASPLVFATLIDQKPDSQNHVSHLIITREERQKLISEIDSEFGDTLEQKDQNYTVSAASVLKELLEKYKCADDPW